jgi:hypothetical protein
MGIDVIVRLRQFRHRTVALAKVVGADHARQQEHRGEFNAN